MVTMQLPQVTLEWVTPDALGMIERAARTCYKSEDKVGEGSAEKMVVMLIRNKHLAMLEHAVASLRFITDRGVTHELVRHRLASFAQTSTRYCNYAKDKFDNQITVIPMLDGLSIEQLERRAKLYKHMEQVYLAEIAEGIKPQQARDNLPTCLQAEVVVTANFREWLHIFELRTSPAAHPQIRKIMTDARKILADQFPCVFGESHA